MKNEGGERKGGLLANLAMKKSGLIFEPI